MKCPIDGTNLSIAERSGVEIDYCPECRGVWLDRGELDKIIDRSNTYENTAPVEKPRPVTNQSTSPTPNSYSNRKKHSFLSEIFDF